MEKEILEVLKQMQKDNIDFRKEVNNKLDNISIKIESVHDQTAYLTEFRTETKDRLDKISKEVMQIRKDISTVEIVTANNYADIAKVNYHHL